jgi:hypothetical protein
MARGAGERRREPVSHLLKEYRSNPGAVRDKMYYETLAKILPNIEITVLPDNPTAPPQISDHSAEIRELRVQPSGCRNRSTLKCEL